MGQKTKDPSEYINIIAEVYFDKSKHKNEVRPCVGQPFSRSMNIECASEIRNYHVGTKVRLKVVLKKTQGIKPHLYSYYGWAYDVVTDKI